jgi:hypothetical protein
VQLSRIDLEFRVGLQNHVVLVQLRVHGVDLALSERIVERIVDGRWRDAEAGSGGAIDGDRFRHAAQLLIGRHVGQFRKLLEFRQQLADNRVQLILIGVFHRVLVFRAAHAIVHRQVLHRLHV